MIHESQHLYVLSVNASGLLVFGCRTCRFKYDGSSLHCDISVSWVCDHRAFLCHSERNNRHGHWVSSMSTGRKYGSMGRTHTPVCGKSGTRDTFMYCAGVI